MLPEPMPVATALLVCDSIAAISWLTLLVLTSTVAMPGTEMVEIGASASATMLAIDTTPGTGDIAPIAALTAAMPGVEEAIDWGWSHVGSYDKLPADNERISLSSQSIGDLALWVTADVGQGTRESQRADFLCREMQRRDGKGPWLKGAGVKDGDTAGFKRVAGWVDLDELLKRKSW